MTPSEVTPSEVTPSGATPSPMTPGELLAAARDMLQRPASATAGLWPRAAALLARQALEQALDDFWRSRPESAALVSCRRATQFACLPLFLDEMVAGEAAYAWSALSNACHYHPYDLAPTATELDAWMGAVGRLLDSVALRDISGYIGQNGATRMERRANVRNNCRDSDRSYGRSGGDARTSASGAPDMSGLARRRGLTMSTYRLRCPEQG